jgi:D-alanyl-D-alanine carboxypeptidase (penicillin-binding protein 5/6)
VLDAADENARVIAGQQLLDYGFRHYETRLLYAARTQVTKLRVLMGSVSTVPLGPAQDLYLTLPRGWHERVRVRLTVKQEQMAPISLGRAVGTLAVDVDQDPIAEYPLVALEAVDGGNVFQRAADHVRLWFQ